MKRNGFTLIELLAVTILLSILFLLAVLNVSNLLQEARDKSNLNSANAIMKSAENYFVESNMDLSKSAKTNGVTNVYKDLNINKESITSGEVYINKSGKILLTLLIGNKCYQKTFLETEISNIELEECTLLETKESTAGSLTVTGKIVSYKILGNGIQSTSPSVTAPVDLNTVGNISKNLFDETNLEQGGITDATGALSALTTRVRNQNYISLSAGTYYLNNTNNTDINIRNIYLYSVSNQSFVRMISVTAKSKQIVLDAGYLVKIVFQKTDSNLDISVLEVSNSNFQLEVSSTATSYVQHNNIKILTTGKNLFPMNSTNFSSVGITATTQENGTVILNGTSTAHFHNYFDVSLKAGTYTFSCNTATPNSGVSIFLRKFNPDNSYVNYGLTSCGGTGTSTFTLTSNYEGRILYYVSMGVTLNNFSFKPQLELSTVATSFEVYENTSYDIYLDEPLRCVGDVCDYVEFDNNKLVRNVGKYVFTGLESWFSYYQSGEGQSWALTMPNSVLGFQTSKSTHFNNISSAWIPTYINQYGIYSDHNSVYNKYFRSPNSSITTLTQWKSWLTAQYLAGSPVTIYYQLKNSTTEVISLPQVITNSGVTHFNVNGGTTPKKIEVDYFD